jgi:hypothetical protein
LRCRLVESRLPATAAGADPGPEARLAALRAVLEEAVATLQASPGTPRASGRCVGPTWLRRPRKRSPLRYSGCRPAPTGGTCRPGSKRSPTSCGNKSCTPDSLRSGCPSARVWSSPRPRRRVHNSNLRRFSTSAPHGVAEGAVTAHRWAVGMGGSCTLSDRHPRMGCRQHERVLPAPAWRGWHPSISM